MEGLRAKRLSQIEQVSHLRLGCGALPQLLLQMAICPCSPVMLTKVFCPRTHDECFEIPVRALQVSTNPPSRRPVAAADASVLAHRLDELRYSLGFDVVFNRNQDRAVIAIGSDHQRHSPMI